MLTSMGIGDLIGRLALGPLITICKWNVTKMYAASQFLCAIAILSFIFVFNGVQMIIQGVVFSVTFGLQCVLYGNFIFTMKSTPLNSLDTIMQHSCHVLPLEVNI